MASIGMFMTGFMLGALATMIVIGLALERKENAEKELRKEIKCAQNKSFGNFIARERQNGQRQADHTPGYH